MSETFCGVCRHPTPGHEPNCPVLTGEPQRGVNVWPQQDMQPLNQIQQAQLQGQLSQLGQPSQQAEVTRILEETRARATEELKTQVEVNRLLARDLLEARLELVKIKLKYGIVE